jgi:hypothetical protein
MVMAGKAGRLRINLLIEVEADQALYDLLVAVPARRRATLIRSWAVQGLSVGQPKPNRPEPVMISKAPRQEDASLPVPKMAEFLPDQDLISRREKEAALNNALQIVNF